MKIHHVNLGSMCPRGQWWVDGEGGFLAAARLVCHGLVIETSRGLVAVETGIGTAAVAAPKAHLPARFRLISRPRPAADETLVAHVARLGYRREDVRHLVLTHLDVDHAGGMADFPHAHVHVSANELAAATRAGRSPSMRYVPSQWAHGPTWVPHGATGETWFGFEAVRALADAEGDVSPEILLVPLAGHTEGHCGVAVRDDKGWLLHAGDAFFSRHEVDPDRPHCPPGLAAFQWLFDTDRRARLHNQRRLRQLVRDHGRAVRVINAHDRSYLEARPEAPRPAGAMDEAEAV